MIWKSRIYQYDYTETEHTRYHRLLWKDLYSDRCSSGRYDVADGDLSQVISVTNGTLDTSASKLDGNQLTIAFTSATSLNGSSSAVTITYKTKLTSDGAQKLYDTIAKSTTLTNTVTNVVVKDGETVLKDKTPNATADISFTKTTPAPVSPSWQWHPLQDRPTMPMTYSR